MDFFFVVLKEFLEFEKYFTVKTTIKLNDNYLYDYRMCIRIAQNANFVTN